MDEVKVEAKRRKVDLVIRPTAQAIELLKQRPDGTNAILHVTCCDLPPITGRLLMPVR
jgi:hypothetical protein